MDHNEEYGEMSIDEIFGYDTKKPKVKRKRVYKSGEGAPAYKGNYSNDEIQKLYWEGKGYREIARILGIKSHNTVKKRIEQMKTEMLKVDKDSELPF